SGGGGGFSGGGSHSYGSGGGGSGNGTGFVIFAVIFIIIILLLVFKNLSDAKRKPFIKPGDIQSDLDDMEDTPNQNAADEAALTALMLRDTTFDPEIFYTRIQTAFVALQNAWSQQNLDPIRPFISDAIYERFTLQFAEQAFLGYRNDMSDIRVYATTLVHTDSDGLYDTVTVRINAAAVDRELTPDGRLRGGSELPAPFIEYWTFLRKSGVASVTTGLMEGNCPNCGAAISINQNARCAHCQAELRGAQYDWVLTEITQAEDWRRATTPELPLLPILRQRDPNFTVADIEDRVSVMFWRILAAQRLGNVNPLRKIATPEFIAGYAPQLAPLSTGQRKCFMDAGVGSVTTIALKPGSAERPDRVLVEIHWSGVTYRVSPDKPPSAISENTPRFSWYLLQRTATGLTQANSTIASAHCPNCGAPLTDTASEACEYCNTPLADGSHGWVLEAVRAHNDPELRQMMDV
ncbi:MAG: Tim44 domain-containing protein, partial [Phycisphaerae bacterium]